MDPIKVNAVIIRGFNDDELLDLVEFGRNDHFEMRLIEYMDVGNASGWTLDKTFSKREMLEIIHARFPVEKWAELRAALPQWTTNSLMGGTNRHHWVCYRAIL